MIEYYADILTCFSNLTCRYIKNKKLFLENLYLLWTLIYSHDSECIFRLLDIRTDIRYLSNRYS